MEITSEAYQSHGVFKDLDRYVDFYKNLAISILPFMTSGTKSMLNIDTYMYSSMEGTLDSIRTILRNGRINDSYSLLRKYYDSTVINIYTTLYLKEQISLENLIVRKIQEWLDGKLQLPEYVDMMKYIRNSETAKDITTILLSDDRYKRVRDRCNSYTHYKFFQHVLVNDNEIRLPMRLQYLKAFRVDILDMFILHISYTFFVNFHYMMSSDYRDALELGMQPEENSQYWVAPFVQSIFDDVVTPYRPAITSAIRDASSMQVS